VSDQQPEQIGGESGSLSAGISHSNGTPSEPVMASAAETSQAADGAVSEPSVSETVASEAPKVVEAPKVEAVKAEASAQAEAATDKISHTPGKVIVMSRGDRAWADKDIHTGPEEQQGVFGKRRIAAIAAMVALATAAGAVGGALATSAFMRGGAGDVAMSGSQTALEVSLSRIDSDIQSLKTGVEHTSRLGMSQFNKTSERLDKLERAQAEPAAKIAKLSEAVDKLRAAPVAASAVAIAPAPAPKDTTGSISTAPATQQAAATPPKTETKPEVGRLPTVDGWVLRDVAQGGALIDGRRGIYEVYAGDFIPGLGRIDAIRRQDGRWVVVTSRGLIVARQ
jgi:hypothetical protein